MTMISTQMAADIMNLAFQTILHVQGQHIRIQCLMAIRQSPIRSLHKMTKHTQKQKQSGSLRSICD